RAIPLVALAAAAIPACASDPTPPPSHAKRSAPAEVASAPVKRPVPPGHLRREDVLAVLSDGVPVFLRKVDVDPVRDRGGRFHGWRIVSLKDDELASGALKPGDVLRLVNGKPIEDPYQFYDVFQSLAFAPELHLSLERDGAPSELRFPIDEDPNAAPVPRAD